MKIFTTVLVITLASMACAAPQWISVVTNNGLIRDPDYEGNDVSVEITRPTFNFTLHNPLLPGVNLPPTPPLNFFSLPGFNLQLGQKRFFLNWLQQLKPSLFPGLNRPSPSTDATTTTTTTTTTTVAPVENEAEQPQEE